MRTTLALWSEIVGLLAVLVSMLMGMSIWHLSGTVIAWLGVCLLVCSLCLAYQIQRTGRHG